MMALHDKTQWSLGDLDLMKKLSIELEADTIEIKDSSLLQKRKVVELQSLLLKSETKKDEISRFIRARKDPEFARIVKVRQLGPEHIENQQKLRKSMQSINDGLMKVEDQLNSLKAKVISSKSGKGSFKVPSIDSINRSTRALGIAINDKNETLDELIEKVEKMKLSQNKSRSISIQNQQLSQNKHEHQPDSRIVDKVLNDGKSRIQIINSLRSKNKDDNDKNEESDEDDEFYQFDTNSSPLSINDIPTAEAIRKKREEKSKPQNITPTKNNDNYQDNFSPGSRDNEEVSSRHHRQHSGGGSGMRQKAVNLPKHQSPIIASNYFAFK